MSTTPDKDTDREAQETENPFHDGAGVEVYITAPPWRLSRASNSGLWRLDNFETGMIVPFNAILISGGSVKFYRNVESKLDYTTEGKTTASFVNGTDVFPEELADWILAVEHTGEIKQSQAPTDPR